MTDKRKKRIRELAAKLDVSRRGAANRLDAGRHGEAHQEASGSEPLTLGQLLAAVHELFEENREGSTFTAQVNSLRLPEPYQPGGLVPEVPLVTVQFEQTDEGWTFAGSLVFIDGEVYDGVDKLDAAWLKKESGRARAERTIRDEIKRAYAPLAPVLADLRVGGGRNTHEGRNIVLDVNLTLALPLYALLRRLHTPSTFSVLTGRVAAVGGSASLVVAREQARRLANDPQWYAESGGVTTTVTKGEHELLIANGAADDRRVQMIRSFRDEHRMTFAEQCDNCRRWISCGDGEHGGVCVCGQQYRVIFDLPKTEYGSLRPGPCCMDCGKEVRMREWVGPRQPWRVVNDDQRQCDDCYVGQAHKEVVDAGRRLSEIQGRVLKTKPLAGAPGMTDPKDLAALEDADRRYREATAAELQALAEQRRGVP